VCACMRVLFVVLQSKCNRGDCCLRGKILSLVKIHEIFSLSALMTFSLFSVNNPTPDPNPN